MCMCTRLMPADAEYRLKSTPHSAAPNELDRPGLPSLYSELVSPRTRGGSVASPSGQTSSYWAIIASTTAAVRVWFRRVSWRVTPGVVAPDM